MPLRRLGTRIPRPAAVHGGEAAEPGPGLVVSDFANYVGRVLSREFHCKMGISTNISLAANWRRGRMSDGRRLPQSSR